MIDLDYLANIRPSPRQYEWQKLEFYGFVHFGMNTMTDREWGTGDEDPAWFDPDQLNTDEWAAVASSAGMRGLILTCKHHDGFCLWPSKYTTHSVAASPWRGGRGDLVREVSRACERHGLRFGIYLSPWDRHEPSYGTGQPYDDFYVAQLVELLTGYGPVFSVWLDGANGEGAEGRRQVYDWDRYVRTIRALQPEAVISVSGPDVRWCGNEAGHTRPDEWSVVSRELQDAERVAAHSQTSDDGRFSRFVKSGDDDLGSRKVLPDTVGDLVWYPAEVNTSTRRGWFHHAAEDAEVRSSDELFDIYQRAVGGNSTLLLNVPPTKRGRISDADRSALEGLGTLIDELHSASIKEIAFACSSNPLDVEPGQILTLANDTGWWEPAADDTEPWIELTLASACSIDGVVLKEQITQGQRIEQIRVLRDDGARWTPIAEIGCVGYQRICRFTPVVATRVRFEITRSRRVPTLAGVAVLASSRQGRS